MPYPRTCYVLTPCAALDPMRGIHALSLAARYRIAPPTRAHSPTALLKFRQLANMIMSPFMLSAPNGREILEPFHGP